MLARGVDGFENAKIKANELRKLHHLKWDQIKFKAETIVAAAKNIPDNKSFSSFQLLKLEKVSMSRSYCWMNSNLYSSSDRLRHFSTCSVGEMSLSSPPAFGRRPRRLITVETDSKNKLKIFKREQLLHGRELLRMMDRSGKSSANLIRAALKPVTALS